MSDKTLIKLINQLELCVDCNRHWTVVECIPGLSGHARLTWWRVWYNHGVAIPWFTCHGYTHLSCIFAQFLTGRFEVQCIHYMYTVQCFMCACYGLLSWTIFTCCFRVLRTNWNVISIEFDWVQVMRGSCTVASGTVSARRVTLCKRISTQTPLCDVPLGLPLVLHSWLTNDDELVLMAWCTEARLSGWQCHFM